MASSINPAGYIDDAVVDNHVQVAGERGFTVDEWADHVEPESEHLAAVLRKRASDARAIAAAESSDSTDDTPKGRRSAPSETA